MASNRVVAVSLQAKVANYLSGMEQARKATAATGTAAEQAKAKLERQSQAMTAVGTGMLAMGALAAAGVGLAIKKFADFDQAISNVKAATQESADNMGLLREAALQAGADTAFSATEAANAVEELGKAGLSTADILSGGLDGALSLAAAGGLGVAEAAGYAATALKTFNLQGSDMNHVADLMAAGAGKAMGDVSDLAGALNQAGLVANATGLSIEETTGSLAAFASKGLLGSDAGTSFKAMLQRLTPQSEEASKAMEALGISAYDAQGNFIGMEKFAGNLQMSMKKLSVEQRSSAMNTIFGSDAVRAANVLYSEGAEGIADWNAQVSDSGYAAQVAADRLDNLAGDVEALGGSFDTALIKSGSAANDSLRFLVQTVTSLINVFSGAPPIVQEVALGLGIAAAGIGIVGGGALIAVPKIAAMKLALLELGGTARGLAASTGAIGLAITVAAVAISAFATQQANAKARIESLTDSLDASTGAFTRNTREAVINELNKSKVGKMANLYGISTKTMTDAILGNADALKIVNEKLAEQRKLAKESGATGSLVAGSFQDIENAISGTKGELANAKQEWKEHQIAMGESTDESEDAVPVIEAVTEAVDGAVSSVMDLAAELDSLNGIQLDAREAARNLEAAYASFDDALEKNGASLNEAGTDFDIATEAGRENQAALDGIAEAATAAGQAIVDSGGSYDDYRASLEGSKAQIDQRIADLGITGDAAQILSDKILNIPTAAEFAMYADTEAAAARLQAIQDLINGIGKTMSLHVSAGPGSGGMTVNADGNMHAYANGGFGSGIYSGRTGGIHKFAEPETRWEAYISGKPGMEKRNQGIALDALSRLGYTMPAQYAAPNVSAGSSSGSARSGAQVSMAVHTSPGMSEATVGRVAADQLNYELRRR